MLSKLFYHRYNTRTTEIASIFCEGSTQVDISIFKIFIYDNYKISRRNKFYGPRLTILYAMKRIVIQKGRNTEIPKDRVSIIYSHVRNCILSIGKSESKVRIFLNDRTNDQKLILGQRESNREIERRKRRNDQPGGHRPCLPRRCPPPNFPIFAGPTEAVLVRT